MASLFEAQADAVTIQIKWSRAVDKWNAVDVCREGVDQFWANAKLAVATLHPI